MNVENHRILLYSWQPNSGMYHKNLAIWNSLPSKFDEFVPIFSMKNHLYRSVEIVFFMPKETKHLFRSCNLSPLRVVEFFEQFLENVLKNFLLVTESAEETSI